MTDPGVARRIWEWLPARADSRRVTLPLSIATALNLPTWEVAAALAEMERDGHAIRDAATGRQGGWHRGNRLPAVETTGEPEEEWTLY